MLLLFDPPLLNSANPWATTRNDIQALYDCPHTGAVTIRTSIFGGFEHDDRVHQFQLLGNAPNISSLNTLGYSPISFEAYCSMTLDILSKDNRAAHLKKPVIFSVTGGPEESRTYYKHLCHLQSRTQTRVLMEINLSCPNITGKEPPAYSCETLISYLKELRKAIDDGPIGKVDLGIKLPPYTHATQFSALASALLSVNPCPLTFITSTNTLGSCLFLSDDLKSAINSETGTGIGGLAGETLHPLALGNVRTIRGMLNMHESLKWISIIGIGGVSDGAGFRRMRAVGAEAVAVGTALGVEGVAVFEKVLKEAKKLENGDVNLQMPDRDWLQKSKL